jgi:hypothetical protein
LALAAVAVVLAKYLVVEVLVGIFTTQQQF